MLSCRCPQCCRVVSPFCVDSGVVVLADAVVLDDVVHGGADVWRRGGVVADPLWGRCGSPERSGGEVLRASVFSVVVWFRFGVWFQFLRNAFCLGVLTGLVHGFEQVPQLGFSS